MFSNEEIGYRISKLCRVLFEKGNYLKASYYAAIALRCDGKNEAAKSVMAAISAKGLQSPPPKKETLNVTGGRVKAKVGIDNEAGVFDNQLRENKYSPAETAEIVDIIVKAYGPYRIIFADDSDTHFTMVNDALALDSSNVPALTARAMLFMDKHQWDIALKDVNMALELRPDYDLSNMIKGNILVHLGQVDQADDCYRKAYACKPSSKDDIVKLRERALREARQTELCNKPFLTDPETIQHFVTASSNEDPDSNLRRRKKPTIS